MGTWKYRKTEASNIRGLCVLCKKNPQKKRLGNKYKPLCSSCDKKEFGDYEKYKKRVARKVEEKRRPYILFKKNVCEGCGFIPIHSCQLDVDHINGGHNDNEESNLQTLCANCHRLKTFRSQDWKKETPFIIEEGIGNH